MATANILPIYARLSERILRTVARRREAGGTEILEGLDRLWLALRCPVHSWSWPRTNKEDRCEGFDAHQTCHKCASLRFFDSRAWHGGPVYRRREYATK